jgi:hypothetical protein
MIAWTGQSGPGGIPHLSYVKRKPQPLGAELKTVCDGSSGVCLYAEMQEGKERMQRLKYCIDHGATTACTLRMISKMGLNETNLDDDKKPQRVVVADSWFASRKTAIALKDLLGLHLTGPIKTATRGFPIEAIRWSLVGLDRGDHVVFKEEGADRWAVGWSDIHFKCYITTHGLTGRAATPALKKRQRLDGRHYQIPVRPIPRMPEPLGNDISSQYWRCTDSALYHFHTELTSSTPNFLRPGPTPRNHRVLPARDGLGGPAQPLQARHPRTASHLEDQTVADTHPVRDDWHGRG